MELPGNLTKYWRLGPLPRDTDLIEPECGFGGESFSSCPVDCKVQPRLGSTEWEGHGMCSSVIYKIHRSYCSSLKIHGGLVAGLDGSVWSDKAPQWHHLVGLILGERHASRDVLTYLQFVSENSIVYQVLLTINSFTYFIPPNNLTRQKQICLICKIQIGIG